MSNSFPSDFIWGAATASYQIEGGVREDGRSPSIWDTFSHTPGKIRNGDTGDIASDHYHRWPADLALLKALGVDAYRFSTAWPRILPGGTGPVNQPGLDFYSKLVDALLEAGIAPAVTLYHWDLPQVLQDQGGWPERFIVDAFVEYADVVTRHLGDRVKFWITHNEPFVFCILGYGMGMHAPGLTDYPAALRATHHTLLSHGRAVPVIRQNSPGAQVGITLNPSYVYPISDSAYDVRAAALQDALYNRWYSDPLYGMGYPQEALALYRQTLNGFEMPIEPGDMETIAVPTDFLGINTYNPTFAGAAEPTAENPLGIRALDTADFATRGIETTYMGWPVVPEAMTDLLLYHHQRYPSAPLYITENGAAYPDALNNGAVRDPQRVQYLHDYISAMQTAMDQGAQVRGYFVWSALDNFEWAYGCDKRFGIIYVDYETLARIPKASYRWYQQVIQANAIVPVDGV